MAPLARTCAETHIKRSDNVNMAGLVFFTAASVNGDDALRRNDNRHALGVAVHVLVSNVLCSLTQWRAIGGLSQ